MIKHLSYSQVNTYRKCGKLYYYVYVLGKRIIPPWVFLYGRAVEGGLNYNFTQKIKSRKDISISKVLEAFDYTWTGETQKEEFDWKGENKAKIKDGGVRCLEVYHKERSPLFQPVAIQDKFKFMFANVDYGFQGYLDMIDERDAIVDFKTSQKSPVKARAVMSDQLTAYSLGYRVKYKKPESTVNLEFLVNLKKAKTVALSATRTKEEIDAYLKVIGEVHKGIKKEVFTPCSQEGWWCSIGSCGFFPLCKPHRTVAMIEKLQREENKAKAKKEAEAKAKKGGQGK